MAWPRMIHPGWARGRKRKSSGEATETAGLKHVSCEEWLWGWVWFGSVGTGMASQHITASWCLQKWITGTGTSSAQWCLLGKQETLAETGEVQARFRKNFSPCKNNQAAGSGYREMLPSWEGFQTT